MDKELWSAAIRGLVPYRPGEQPSPGERVIKLNTNENPYPPSPACLSALREAVAADLRLYPDPEGRRLKEAVAAAYGLGTGNVFLGNGSDEVLAHAFFALLRQGRPLLFPDITYSFYPVYCALYGIAYETIPLDGSFQVRIADYERPNGGIVLANPNAPTGIAIDLAGIRRLLEQSPRSVVLIDEAYVDFGAESAVPLVAEYPNLLVVQTFSKSRALAGLRISMACGAPSLVAALNTVKDSFNSYPLGRLALIGAEAAFRDVEYFQDTCRRIMESREWLAGRLQDLGFQVLPSRANFLFVRHPSRRGGELQQGLRRRGVLVRRFPAPRIEDFLRVSVGTEEECRILVETLEEILTHQP
ncbi:MAG: histidinol-phosphate transaminase [Pseudomonadota bacterium]|nr:histidinol-phosphate transaminase [Pseudomonadota bacterium]